MSAKKKQPSIFLTSDTFFGRNLSAINRGFNNSEEMEDHMIELWNDTIKADDVVYHLGNFAWDPISAESAINFLNGRIYFITGKYDTFLGEISLIKTKIHSIFINQIGTVQKQNFIFTHWPLLDWPGKEEGYFQFHGGEMDTDMKNRRINVNCEKWGLKPVSLDSLLDIESMVNK